MKSRFVNFSIRLTSAERAELARLATQMQRKPGDAVRVIIREKAAQLSAKKKTASISSNLAGGEIDAAGAG